MAVIRTGKVLPGYHTDTFSKSICESLEFNLLCVYTLPKKLIEAIRRYEPGLFSADQLDKELEFANNYPDSVVFKQGTPKQSLCLSELTPPPDEATFREIFGGASYRSVCDAIDGPLRKIRQFGSAYCGWIVQQESYQNDLAELRATLLSSDSEPACDSVSEIESQDDVTGKNKSNGPLQLDRFCGKWRLNSLITSELPDPLMPHLSNLNFYARETKEGATVPFIPDTFPVQGKGMVVDQLNLSRQNSSPAHLRIWFALASKNSGNSRPFETLARQYRLQHYWRVFKTRFPDQMKRKQHALSHVFADFLETSQDSIRRDFQALKKQSQLLDIPIETRL